MLTILVILTAILIVINSLVLKLTIDFKNELCMMYPTVEQYQDDIIADDKSIELMRQQYTKSFDFSETTDLEEQAGVEIITEQGEHYVK